MARPQTPTIPDDKVMYFSEQLYRELSHMFEWKNLPQTVPADYLERKLIRHGYVLYYEDENIGQDVLQCEVTGYNRHELPISARTFTPTLTTGEKTTINRNIKRQADSDNAIEQFQRLNDGVLITNMPYQDQSVHQIVQHFAVRLALAQQAFDTNLMWANVPYIFQTSSKDTKLSIEKMFADIFSGKPFIITDQELMVDNKDRAGVPSGIQFIGKELLDTQNEIMMLFKQTVGFNTAGVDKAERVNTLEIESNDQHTQTVLQVMLGQRQKAVEDINAFFGTNIEVDVLGNDPEQEPMGEGGNGDGTGDSGTGEITDPE